MTLAVDRQKHFIHVPCIPGPGPTATQPIGVVLPELAAPLADRFVGHVDTTFELQLFDIAVAQGEPIVESDAVAHDFSGKAMILVTLGVGGSGHTWLPIGLSSDGSCWIRRRHDYVMGWERWSTS
jgi:hypothetical protein